MIETEQVRRCKHILNLIALGRSSKNDSERERKIALERAASMCVRSGLNCIRPVYIKQLRSGPDSPSTLEIEWLTPSRLTPVDDNEELCDLWSVEVLKYFSSPSADRPEGLDPAQLIEPLAICGPVADAENLSSDQVAAIEKIIAAVRAGEWCVTLSGLAGTGKTWLLGKIAKRLEHDFGLTCVFAAPTGMAAALITEKIGARASTVHSALRYTIFEDSDGNVMFRYPQSPIGADSVLIIDEASMLTEEMMSDIRACIPDGSTVILAGDPGQIGPVKAEPGVDLSKPTAMLTQIHRQGLDSGIITAAYEVRQGKHICRVNQKDVEVRRASLLSELPKYGMDSVIDWFEEMKARSDDPNYVTMLSFKNDTVAALNLKSRARKDVAISYPVIGPGDVVCVRSNNRQYDVWNGETYMVETASRDYGYDPVEYLRDCLEMPRVDEYIITLRGKGGKRFRVRTDLIGKPQFEFRTWLKENTTARGTRFEYLHVHYGDCLTIHCAQGRQWKNVGVVIDQSYDRIQNQKEKSSLGYTAMTRASEKLVIFKTVW